MVKSIWPVRTLSAPSAIVHQILDGDLAPVTRPKRSRSVLDPYAPHVMGGVDKLHDEGTFGSGMTVGIIDTGVDCETRLASLNDCGSSCVDNHPALGGAIGPGHKIAYGIDLVGDGYNGRNTPQPDNDPMDCLGHGTHVAGIFGADMNPYNFTGVAPAANIAVFKVFGCLDGTSNDILISAFNLAHEHGVDLISSSVGGPGGWPEGMYASMKMQWSHHTGSDEC